MEDRIGLIMKGVYLLGGLLIAAIIIFFITSTTGDITAQPSRVNSSTELFLGDNGTSSTLANTPTSLLATTYNQTWLEFDGVNDAVTITNKNTINKTTVSISFWVKIDPKNNGTDIINKYGFGGGGSRDWAFFTSGMGNISFRMGNGTNVRVSLTGKSQINDSQWHHIVGVTNRTKSELYVDGLLDTTGQVNDEVSLISVENIVIGENDQTALRLNGSFDELYLMNYHLVGQQIKEIKNQSIHGEGFGDAVISIYYHQVHNNIANNTVNTTQFTEEMAYLNNSGFETITSKDLYNWSIGKINLPDKPILITFDDGWISVFTNATPIMDSFGFVGIIGIRTDAPSSGDSDYMNWTQLKNLSDKGWEMASHSKTHQNMTNLNTSQRISEFNDSKSAIFGNLSINPITFIYPLNARNSTTDEECALFYSMCSGYTIGVPTIYKTSNLTSGGYKRQGINNATSMPTFIQFVDMYPNVTIRLKLNENSGTTAYDTSGNANNGTISGATWNNDGVEITRTSGTDYTLSGKTFTLINDLFSWDEIKMYYSWDNGYASDSLQDNFYVGTANAFVILMKILVVFVAVILIGFVVMLLRNKELNFLGIGKGDL